MSPNPGPHWQGPRVRLCPMRRDDVDLWLVEEHEAPRRSGS